MKKRVAVLITGQTRSNSLNSNFNKNTVVLDSFTQHIFNDEFKSKYDYDIFMSVDIIDNNKATQYFGSHLKNIHITETNEFLYPVCINIPNYDSLYQTMQNIDHGGCVSYINQTYQHYRLLCAYYMTLDYQSSTGITYDYILRIRPDSRFMQNVCGLFHILDTSNIMYITEHDHILLFKYELHTVCDLIKYFGTYNASMHEKDFVYRFYPRNKAEVFDDRTLIFCPEKQYMDHVYHTITNLGYDFKKVFLGITYPSFNLLFREDGSYGHEQYTADWKPYYLLEDLMNTHLVHSSPSDVSNNSYT
jgi:hypothetical protein